MIDGHGYIRLPEGRGSPVKRDDRDRLEGEDHGRAFGGMSGLYAGQSTRERELILLNLLGGQRPVSIAAGRIAPA